MVDEPPRETRREMTDEERQADFERRMVTDYSTLPPEYLAEIQRRMREADERDRQAS